MPFLVDDSQRCHLSCACVASQRLNRIERRFTTWTWPHEQAAR
ncbi:MAG: hypothetical protein EPO09_13520 [Aquabacterium sp.]|nr:MAG: hypothetical protein EPO09_13520 [Aquabacterium sp.]